MEASRIDRPAVSSGRDALRSSAVASTTASARRTVAVGRPALVESALDGASGVASSGGTVAVPGATRILRMAGVPPGSASSAADPEVSAVAERVQRSAMGGTVHDRGASDQAAEGRAGFLPGALRGRVERMSGFTLDDVRVHHNSTRPDALGAVAVTEGTEIHLGRGQEHHLAHEAWHVVQQLEGRVRAASQFKGRALNDDPALEREADEMAARVLGSAAADGPQRARRPRRGGAVVSQRKAKAGLEYTEELQNDSLMARFNGVAATAKSADMSVEGTPFAIFYVTGSDAERLAALGGDPRDDDATAWAKGAVRLTNDVRSAEWIIEGHTGEGVTHDEMDVHIDALFRMRRSLRAALQPHEAPGRLVVFTPAANTGGGATLTTTGEMFAYLTRPVSRGAAQITMKYRNKASIRRINEVNASKHLKGGRMLDDLAYVERGPETGFLSVFTSDVSAPAKAARRADRAVSRHRRQHEQPQVPLAGGRGDRQADDPQ